ncbi:MAG: hypothetical protein ACLR0B_16010 [Anaerobutyricum soehngenii]
MITTKIIFRQQEKKLLHFVLSEDRRIWFRMAAESVEEAICTADL